MLTRLTVRQMKVLDDIELGLGRKTVLVGPNGCGKSTVLDALDLLCTFAVTEPPALLTGARDLGHLRARQAAASRPMELALEGRGTTGSVWHLAWRSVEEPAGSRSRAEYVTDGGGPTAEAAPEAEAVRHDEVNEPNVLRGDLSLRSVAPALVPLLPRTLFLQPDPVAVARPVYHGAASEPVLARDGSNLAAVLAYLKLGYTEVFDRIESSLTRVVPGVRRIRFRPATVEVVEVSAPVLPHVGPRRQKYVGQELLFDTSSGTDIPACAMSEGTLRILTLLTAALGRQPHRLLLLDDLEQGVHPRAVHELMVQLQQALEVVEDLQLVATTHSPYLLDEFAPDEIRLMWLDATGKGRCVAMPDHPEFERWKEMMLSPAELWSVMDRPPVEERQ